MKEAEILELFNKESIFIGERDVITVKRAKELFGENAVNYAIGLDRDTRTLGIRNEYYLGWGNPSLEYLHMDGLKKVVTYHNIVMLATEEIKKEGGAAKERAHK